MNKKPDRGLIFIKATVISLGIVLITLIAALFLLKNKQKNSDVNCSNLEIKINGKIVQFKSEENSIIILTEADKQKKQEVIKVDNHSCPKVINRFTIENAK